MEQEPKSQASGSNQCSFVHEFSNGSCQLEKLDSLNGLPIFDEMESELITGSHSHTSSNRLSGSRPHVSSPPGFSVPNKTPPPGFTYHDRTDQMFDGTGNHFYDANSVSRHRSPPADNTIINGDIEFIDPATLAIGKGLLPGSVNYSGVDNSRMHYSSHLNAHEEAKFQSILQRYIHSHQNQRFTNLGESFSPLGDTYSIHSKVTVSQLRKGIEAWDMHQAKLLRNERLGFNNRERNTISQSRKGIEAWNEHQTGMPGNDFGMAEVNSLGMRGWGLTTTKVVRRFQC